VEESAPDIRTHPLHVVAVDDPQGREWLLFREELGAEEALREVFGSQERSAGVVRWDRRRYTEAKNTFISCLLHPGPIRRR